MRVEMGIVAEEHTVRNLERQELAGTQDEWDRWVRYSSERVGEKSFFFFMVRWVECSSERVGEKTFCFWVK